jgi:hypothetical protein
MKKLLTNQNICAIINSLEGEAEKLLLVPVEASAFRWPCRDRLKKKDGTEEHHEQVCFIRLLIKKW